MIDGALEPMRQCLLLWQRNRGVEAWSWAVSLTVLGEPVNQFVLRGL